MSDYNPWDAAEAAEKLFRNLSDREGVQVAARDYAQATAHLHHLAGKPPVPLLPADQVERFYPA